MTNTIKLSFGAVALLLGSLLFVSVASAATFTNAEFSGNTEVYGNPGQNKDVTLRVIVPTGEEVEFIETDIISDGLGPVCNKVGGNNGLQEGTHNVKLSLKLPPLPDFYDLEVDGVGIFGAIRAVDCEDGAAVHSTDSFADVIRVIANSSSSNDELGSEEQSLIASLQAMIKDLMAQIKALQNPPAPVKPAFCANIVIYNGSNAWTAQASLLANGFAAPFNAIGVYQPTGFWGTASTAAASQAANACK